MSFNSFYKGKVVLVTGHTGFKGGWLVTWLKMMGARVVGFSLPPEMDKPNLFEFAKVDSDIVSIFGDIRNLSLLTSTFKTHKPEIVFHMAAQSLVRRSYTNPVDTFATNVMGTVNVLEAVKCTESVKTAIIVTSDKCYENREWVYAYRENDPLGGYDPYSASKGCCEIVTAAYRSSFFSKNNHVAIASVRAGNVIGGGDWAEDRIIPDIVMALSRNKPVVVRNPNAIRPWQYVLEPLSGYLYLAMRMCDEPHTYAGAWNFGPNDSSNVPVKHIVELAIKEWGAGMWERPAEDYTDKLHEANFLKLDCTKAATLLEWFPIYSLNESIKETIEWYKNYYRGKNFDGCAVVNTQIKRYMQKAHLLRAIWAGKEE